jgi:Rieske [2Fe-2S] domain
MALNTFLSLPPQCHCQSPFKSSVPPPKTAFYSQKTLCKRNRRLSLRVATPSSSTTPISREQEEGQVEEPTTSNSSSDEKFSWRDHWYPVSLVEDLDPRYPIPFQLLNRDLVIWKDPNSGEWVALDDKCPHRLAPLSVIFLSLDVPLLFCSDLFRVVAKLCTLDIMETCNCHSC